MKCHLVIFSVFALVIGCSLTAITTPNSNKASHVSKKDIPARKTEANNKSPQTPSATQALKSKNTKATGDTERELKDSPKGSKARKLYRSSYNSRNSRYSNSRNSRSRNSRGRSSRYGRRRRSKYAPRRRRKRGPPKITKWDRQRMLRQKKKAGREMRASGCILTAEFRHAFYNLLTRSTEFTIQFFSNCANIPEITYRVFYKNHMFINWYNHPTEIFVNLFNSVYRLEFKKPKQINEFDITKAMMYQELKFFGNKKNPKPIDLNYDNQILLDKQHKYAFEPKNMQKLAAVTRPLPCFVQREMVKGWKKIIKKRLLIKAQKKKLLQMMSKMMANNQKGRQLSLVDDVPGMKTIVNKSLFRTADDVHKRVDKVKAIKSNIRLVKKKGISLTRSLKLVNSKRNIERYLKSKAAAKKKTTTKKKTTKKKKPKKKKKKLSKAEKARLKAKAKLEKFKKMVKKVSIMKYKMNRANLLKKMKKKLIKGYYLICASP